jgi:hypothetical protein
MATRHHDPDKKHKKPFSVGPANLPDGGYRRKGTYVLFPVGEIRFHLLTTVKFRRSRAT